MYLWVNEIWKSLQYYKNEALDDQWKLLLQFLEVPYIKLELELSWHSGQEGVHKSEIIYGG